MFLDADPARRFLVADEVGLGKTLVARGLIAKTIDHLWDSIDRIDVIYICSNANIAKQNINRLNITEEREFEITSRITLLPVSIRDFKSRKLNFISFTPGTSFDLRSALGTAQERVLIYWLLRRAWDLRGTAALNVLQGYAGTENFRLAVDEFLSANEIDASLEKSFKDALVLRPDLRGAFEQLCEQFGRPRRNIPDSEREEQRKVVGELRTLLATTCLSALEPDLVILDEFQRFKHLLDGTEAAGELAQGFFSNPQVRTLLLSATPYKMLTLQEDQAEGDDHHQDFRRTVDFLQNNASDSRDFSALLEEYRRELFRMGSDRTNQACELASQVSATLRRVMVRTERLSVSEDRNGMLRVVKPAALRLEPREVRAYVQLQRIARILKQNDAMEYWKSAPYLLNFMDQYEIKDAFEEALDAGAGAELPRRVVDFDALLLSAADVQAYKSIDPNNVRLRSLLADTVDRGAGNLLWLPPCLPYYRLGEPFANPALQGFTKRLVFSAWQVVPRMVASLLSYEVERKLFAGDSYTDPGSGRVEPPNTPAANKRRSGRRPLRFARTADRLTGMPVLALMYPCQVLADDYDPLQLMLQNQRLQMDDLLEVSDLVKQVSASLNKRLEQIGANSSGSRAVDETWYWAAPIMLDLQSNSESTRAWFEQADLANLWAGFADLVEEEGGEPSRWAEHVSEALMLVRKEMAPLGRAPADLADVLAQLALAGPAITGLRALRRVVGTRHTGTPEIVEQTVMLNAAGQLGWSLISLFNQPAAVGVVRQQDLSDPYWRRMLEYCVNGCLQSVLDEYVHTLRESLGFLSKSTAANICKLVSELVAEISSALNLRTSSLRVDYFGVARGRIREIPDGPPMRSHFAVRFGDDKSDVGEEQIRSTKVRAAFNSPFWPFVLATTSVGQEGLDFHTYCHAVVHWNLPSNPVDLEQREGRVHRYKGHAIRKNLIQAYGRHAMDGGSPDPWAHLFAIGVAARAPDATDLVPYWVLDVPNGAKIERHVPAMPHSRDARRLELLRRSLAVYRMVFGQARQEDLLASLLGRFSEHDLAALMQQLKIDLSPPVRAKQAAGVGHED
ncbi:MAG: helicase-related protein [Chloroflexi bacterium]|nr:helicase-related protein [Chloroflexota bacterium]